MGVIDYPRGYQEVRMTDEQLAHLYSHPHDNSEIEAPVNGYVVVKNMEGETVDVRKWDGVSFMKLKFNPIANAYMGTIKPRNLEQRMAFDMLQDDKPVMKVLTGCFGSGKDLMMIGTALDLIVNKGKFEKLIWVRNNVGVKDAKEVGFLPGTLDEKLEPWACILGDHLGGMDQVRSLIAQEKIELRHLGYMRGRDVHNAIILCTEAENLTAEHVQLLMGRVAEGTQLWMNGDYRQVDAKVFKGENNGLIKAVKRLTGEPEFAHVHLVKSERSSLAQLADKLDDTYEKE